MGRKRSVEGNLYGTASYAGTSSKPEESTYRLHITCLQVPEHKRWDQYIDAMYMTSIILTQSAREPGALLRPL